MKNLIIPKNHSGVSKTLRLPENIVDAIQSISDEKNLSFNYRWCHRDAVIAGCGGYDRLHDVRRMRRHHYEFPNATMLLDWADTDNLHMSG